ncbi:hypothetical protein [Microseira wollei]|nr:hypothetical protein [Microseira wollei]
MIVALGNVYFFFDALIPSKHNAPNLVFQAVVDNDPRCFVDGIAHLPVAP